MSVFVQQESESQLLELVLALGPAGRFTRRLHGGEQQGDQDTNHGDDDKQLYECKAGPW